MASKVDPDKGTEEYFKKYPWARVEEPTIAKHALGGEQGDVIKHPAFGQVTVSRVSGSTVLYDSEFRHQHFVRVSVHPSETHRHLARDWHHHSLSPLIEFDMSEAQWANFVSSFGSGSGTCCTLRYITDKGTRFVPRLPDPRVEAIEHTKDGNQALELAVSLLNDLEADIQAEITKLPKATQARLLEKVRNARGKLTGTLPFIAKSFKEHMENLVEKGKVEVYGFINHHVQRAGLAALGVPLADATQVDHALEPLDIEHKEVP